MRCASATAFSSVVASFGQAPQEQTDESACQKLVKPRMSAIPELMEQSRRLTSLFILVPLGQRL